MAETNENGAATDDVPIKEEKVQFETDENGKKILYNPKRQDFAMIYVIYKK